MHLKPTKNSARKYLIVVFLILVIFGITAGLFVNFSKIPLLKSVKKIVQVQNDFTKLDSCIFKLYDAENSCRMYMISGERTYYTQFVKEIKEISLIMDTIQYENLKQRNLPSESFDALIQQKKLRTAQFIQLKRLSDSLINFAVEVDKNVEKINPQSKLFTARQFKSIIKIDTLKSGIAAQPKKKFFGRILSAINDKGKAGIDSSRSTYVKTSISADTSSLNVAYNKLQLKAINDYYLKLYRINHKIKSKEKELLDVNHQLITTIINGLKTYKTKEKDYYSIIQNLTSVNNFNTIENLDKFTVALLALAGGLISLVFYMVYNFYKNEKALIEYSNKASLYALSKSRFLANMSHEIRTPLNSIVGFSEQLTQVELEVEQKQQIGAIRNSSIMLLDVVNDILDFSKYETGKVTLEMIPFSPFNAIKDVFDSMKIQADKKKIGFEMDISIDKEVYILGDPLRLKQVVMNLLSNAIKFTNKGEVKLQANFVEEQGKNGRLNVCITDSGVGINQLDQKIIFDEFAQVYYSSTKEKQQGTGLGLAICKKIVELQGGKIEVNSEELKGSAFSFVLPCQSTEKPAMPVLNLSLKEEDLVLLEGKRILIADDNMLNILLATTILKKYNIIFDAVHNGKEAFDTFTEKDYDLILTDIQMPEMGGVELAKKIRSYNNLVKSATPILGVTANVMQEDREKYLASGMNELVLKPFLEQELLEKILKFMR